MRWNPTKLTRWGLVALLALSTLPAVADHHGEKKGEEEMAEMPADQAAMMEAVMKAGTPGSEHEILAARTGTYEMTFKAWMDPESEPMTSGGTAERELILDGRVLVEHVDASMMGQPFQGVSQTGFDNASGKYWSTWADSMSTGLTVMEGSMDAESHTLTFEGMSPDPMAAGDMRPMRIETTFKDGREVNTFYMPGPDGEMMKSMEVTYVKK